MRERDLLDRDVLRRWRERDRLLRRSRDLDRRLDLERDRLLRRECERLCDLDLFRERDRLERDLDLRLDLLRDRLLVRERERFRDRERCDRDRLVRRSLERERDRERRRLSLASIPITGSIAADIIFCASFTMVMASSISF